MIDNILRIISNAVNVYNAKEYWHTQHYPWNEELRGGLYNKHYYHNDLTNDVLSHKNYYNDILSHRQDNIIGNLFSLQVATLAVVAILLNYAVTAAISIFAPNQSTTSITTTSGATITNSIPVPVLIIPIPRFTGSCALISHNFRIVRKRTNLITNKDVTRALKNAELELSWRNSTADYIDQRKPTSFGKKTAHLAFNKPRKNVYKVLKNAQIYERAVQSLMDQYGDQRLDSFSSDTNRQIRSTCIWETTAPVCTGEEKYRSQDGTCNSPVEPNFGRAMTPLQRILEATYAEGTYGKPRLAESGSDLPSARAVSTSVSEIRLEQTPTDNLRTTYVMQFGQFINHDLDHVPNHQEDDCCNGLQTFPDSFNEQSCFPIKIPDDDSYFNSIGRTCMDFHRAMQSPNLKCEMGKREQMNQITHWLDASNVYGSDNEEAELLRKHVGGKLKVTAHGTEDMLPQCNLYPDMYEELDICGEKGTKTPCQSHCMAAGDIRANEHHGLTVMHTLWMREHNKIAKLLSQQYPSWTDEKLYQEARRIVIAEYQHIAFREWLPQVVGTQFCIDCELTPLQDGYSNAYLGEDADFVPQITNEFAVAAFRLHTLVPSKFSNMHGDQNNPEILKEDLTFFKPELIMENDLVTGFARGMAQQNGEQGDGVFVEKLTNHLFENSVGDKASAMDLIALNIQRGRDHGVPGYNAYREKCGLNKASNFDDLTNFNPEHIEKLKTTYDHVDDIDLFVGGFLEPRIDDAVIGATFRCIIADVFGRLKYGDRFWYDLGMDDKIPNFQLEELAEIRKVTMARIICDNTKDLNEMQPSAFEMSNSNNQAVPCQDLPNLDITKFQGLT